MAPTTRKKNVYDETLAAIGAVAAGATADETATANKIIAKAKMGKEASEIVKLSPPVCAILFKTCNTHNRDWRPTGTKSASEYARRMKAGEWKFNGEGLGFYSDGQLSDGQHRLSGAALAGYELTCPIAYGVPLEAGSTIDDGRARHGSDHATMRGIQDAARKERVLKLAAPYLSGMDVCFDSLASAADVNTAIEANDDMLTQAILIGNASVQSDTSPLPPTQAAAVAFIYLHRGVGKDETARDLHAIQTGAGEPVSVATAMLSVPPKGKTISTAKRLGIYIASALWPHGEPVTKGALRAAVNSGKLPDPAVRRAPEAPQSAACP